MGLSRRGVARSLAEAHARIIMGRYALASRSVGVTMPELPKVQATLRRLPQRLQDVLAAEFFDARPRRLRARDLGLQRPVYYVVLTDALETLDCLLRESCQDR